MQRRSDSRLLVLAWHNVDSTWCFPAGPQTGLRGLARQLRILRSMANVVPLTSALTDLTMGRPIPPRAVAITFDDGYRDNLTKAAPMLRELGLPATCFLVPGILARTTRAWWEELASATAHARASEITWEGATHTLRTPVERYAAACFLADRLKGRNRAARETALDELIESLEPTRRYSTDEHFLDWDEAVKLREHMEIGSHSLHHAILSQESAEQQSADLRTARTQLQEQLEVEASMLAYPNGTDADYTSTTLAAASDAGHSHAVTTRRGTNRATTPRYEVRRTVMAPERGVVDLRKILRDTLR
jgi:peptidoglycan/xylan/chitin deacetylase (PgdA/CDA1 family)